MNRFEPVEYFDGGGRPVIAERRDAPPDYYDRLAKTMYEGVELQNSGQHQFKNDPNHDLRFTQEYSEKNAVGFMLVTAGYYKSNLSSEKLPIPDVRAELADGSTVFVETAEVIESDSARL